MEVFVRLFLSHRYLAFYIVGLSVLRGLVVPDFRYGYLSIIVIQFLYPLLLTLPLLLGKESYLGGWSYLLLSFAGILLSQIVAVGKYVCEFGVDAFNSESGAVMTASFVAMNVLLVAILVLIGYWKK